MFLCSLNLCAASAEYYDEGNDGNSWETAYIIDSVEDFELMQTRIAATEEGVYEHGKYYKLVSDLDLTPEASAAFILEVEGQNEENFFVNGAASFEGHFDGQNHTVNINLNGDMIDEGYTLRYTLFSLIDVPENEIAVRNINITGNAKGIYDIGLATVLYSGIIENCNFSGTMEKSSSPAFAGGLIGVVCGGTVRNCTVSGKISSIGASGGIAAFLHGGTIENCVVQSGSEISALSSDSEFASSDLRCAGGIVGYMTDGYIRNCTSYATVNSPGIKGGIVARILSSMLSHLSGNICSTTSEVGDVVPDRWNGHRYQVFSNDISGDVISWEEAQFRCEALGGHLATITSESEQKFIEELIGKYLFESSPYWIGAKANQYGWWEWVTYEVFEKQYENFAENQPDGSGIYLQIDSQSGKWNDTSSYDISAKCGYICEWDDDTEEPKSAPLSPRFLAWQANPEEWGIIFGSTPSPENTSHLAFNPPNVEINEIPASYDTRLTTGLPTSRDQGDEYRTCWAFASIGAMEADYLAQRMTSLGTSPDLSELHVAWFVYKDPSSDFHMNVVTKHILEEGGDPDKAAVFLGRGTIAPVNETDMPYSVAGNDADSANEKITTFLNGRQTGDFTKTTISLKEAIKFDDINAMSSISHINLIKKAIMDHGAVYFSYRHDEKDGYNSENLSFFSTTDEPRYEHAALLVGWDDDYPAANFIKHTPSRNGAWLVRTSNRVGDDEYGCFWMSYEQAEEGRAMIDIRAFIASEDIQQNNALSEDQNLQLNEHDENGKTKNITPAWSANIFRSERHESLIRIAFYTTDNNAKYQIFVNNFGKNKPTDPGEADIPLLSGDVAYAGYHTLDLPEAINLYNGDYYSVIVKMVLASNYEYPTGAEAYIEKYADVKVNEGESFFATGEPVPSVWRDGKDMEGGPYNACIKSFTIARQTDETEPDITTNSLPDAAVGEEYNFTLESTGTETVEWRSGNIPAGLSLNRNGVLTGYPEEAGEYEINLTAFNNVGVANKVLTLSVAEDPNANTLSSSGGGCDMGLSFLGGMLALTLLSEIKRK